MQPARVEPTALANASSRGFAVPMHAKAEAERYFADVWSILGGPPDEMAEVEDEVSTAAVADDEGHRHHDQPRDAREPLVDVDALEPQE